MNAPLVRPALLPCSRYDEARRAIAACLAVDEVKTIADQAAALHVYATRAKDRQLEIDAAEIRIRAERRIGELIALQRDTVGLARGAAAPHAGPDATRAIPRLAELGIGKALADRSRKYAAMPLDLYEARLAERREAAARTNAAVPVHLDPSGGKAERRAAREAELGVKVRALPVKRYGVILADPEWRFEPWSRETGMDRAAENHYPTSDLATLCAREVESIAAPDCVLALWATVPMLAEAFCLLDAWGFARFERDPATGHLTIERSAGRYVSSGVWHKSFPGNGIGMGRWFRIDHEILLVATRGAPPAPAAGFQHRSVFQDHRIPDWPASRVHSEKPELVADILEAYYPTLPKIELNRRGAPRPGWDAWGNEAVHPEEAAA